VRHTLETQAGRRAKALRIRAVVLDWPCKKGASHGVLWMLK